MGEHSTITDELVADLEAKCTRLNVELAASREREWAVTEVLGRCLRYLTGQGDLSAQEVASPLPNPSPAPESSQAHEVGRDALARTKSADLLEELRQRVERFDGLVSHCNDLTRQRDDLQGLLDHGTVREVRSEERARVLTEQRDELLSVRAALAASQAQEAQLRESLRIAKIYSVHAYHTEGTWRTEEVHDDPCPKCLLEQALADPSPVADALGRVARASVDYRSAWADVQETDDLRARPMAERLAAMRAHIVAATALATEVDTLIAVAPWWSTPKEANRVK